MSEMPFLNPFDNEGVSGITSAPDIEALRRPIGGRALGDMVPKKPGEAPRKASEMSPVAGELCDYFCDVLVGKVVQGRLPECGDTRVIQEVLNGLEGSPVTLGWGKLPDIIVNSLNQFVILTVQRERVAQRTPSRELSKIEITLPEWVSKRSGLDLFANCQLVDLTVKNDISSQFAKGAKLSRIRIEGDVLENGILGNGSENCNFEITGALRSCMEVSDGYSRDLKGSFDGAKNIDVTMERLDGVIGIIANSRVTAKNVDASMARCKVRSRQHIEAVMPFADRVVKVEG